MSLGRGHVDLIWIDENNLPIAKSRNHSQHVIHHRQDERCKADDVLIIRLGWCVERTWHAGIGSRVALHDTTALHSYESTVAERVEEDIAERLDLHKRCKM